MKLGYLLLLVLLFPFAAKAQLKGQNCISVEATLTGNSVTYAKWWIASQTVTYEVICHNDSTNKVVRTLQNVATGTGSGNTLVTSYGTEATAHSTAPEAK
jgi:hypothetical protein